jgi:hypothetical protein
VEDKRRRNLIIALTLGAVALLFGAVALGVASFLFGGPAIYSEAKLAGPPHFYIATSPPLVWWTGMTDYTTHDTMPQILAWYQNSHCGAGFGSPMRCDLTHYLGYGLELSRFVIIQADLNNTVSIRLVTLISFRI